MYSDEIPIGVSAQNVNWDNSHDLKQILGNIDIDNKGDIQQQIDDISSLIMVPDSELSSSSTNAVQNKIIKQALDNKADKTDIPTKTSQLTNDAGFLTSTTAPVTSVNGYTGKVNIDLSGLNRIDGLESRIAELENASGGDDDDDQPIIIDSELLDDSQNPVQNRAIKAAFDGVNNQLNHINQVSRGNSDAIIAHENRIHDLELRPTGGSITIDNAILANSSNPVQNRVIKEALDNKADIGANLSEFTNDLNFLTQAPVTSVNGKRGEIVISEISEAERNMLNDHQNRIVSLENGGSSVDITIDSEFLENSQNPVQSKVIKQALDNKADLQMLNTKATISINEQTNTMVIS